MNKKISTSPKCNEIYIFCSYYRKENNNFGRNEAEIYKIRNGIFQMFDDLDDGKEIEISK